MVSVAVDFKSAVEFEAVLLVAVLLAVEVLLLVLLSGVRELIVEV